MSEILDVLRAIEALTARGEPMALATIVGVEGSTYRREGARLLVRHSGPSVGNLSGGCLEGDVEAKAREVMASGTAQLLRFDLTADDEAVWGWGLGCNGVIDVLIEPADRAAEVAGALRQAIEQGRPVAAVTVLDGDEDVASQGARLLVHPDGATQGSLGEQRLDLGAVDVALRAIADEAAVTATLAADEGSVRVFVEALVPPARLLIFGAGHDAIPLVEFASRLGWRVTVVDDRSAFLGAERFPGAADLVHVARPLDAASAAGADSRTYAVVMSHNYVRDMDYLRCLLGTDIAYLGLLGPRARLDRLLDDLARQGVQASAADRAKLHGPAGLDIGAEGPEEIAWAILAEMLAVKRGRAGGPLRERTAPIHDRSGATTG